MNKEEVIMLSNYWMTLCIMDLMGNTFAWFLRCWERIYSKSLRTMSIEDYR